jgi:RNA polymerase sigma-70 factor, ECF subfamily
LREGRVREPERLASFVLGMCRMVALDLRRGDARRQRLLEQYGLPVVHLPDPSAELDLERLRTCIEKLPWRERTVAILSFYAERSGEEIANELAMTPGNVRVVRHRALGHLQDCMGLDDREGT